MDEEMGDPTIPEDAQDLMSGLYALYAAGILAGFPEIRAFELVQAMFVDQMSTVQAILMGRAEREG